MKRMTRATVADGFYYFGCTVSFDCPICGRASNEKILCEARSPSADRVAAALSQESFDCQLCGAALTSRSKVNIRVLPADLERLRKLGFAIPPAA
jgi:hypothetical protein